MLPCFFGGFVSFLRRSKRSAEMKRRHRKNRKKAKDKEKQAKAEGRKRLPVEDFLRGIDLPEGTQVGV